MRRLVLAASVMLTGALLAGCTNTVGAACDEIERASKKVAIVASDVLLQEVTAGNLEAAAAEIEDYLRPLRDQPMPDELKAAHTALVEDFDELIVAIRAYDTEQIAETSLSIAKTAVDVEVVCA